MEITRKTFVSATAGLVGMTFLSGSALAGAPDDLEANAHLLRNMVGQAFYARGSGGVLVPLALERSVDVRSDTVTEQYTLYFTAGETYSLSEGTWRLVSSNGRRVYEVFLAPAGTASSGDRLYRADFCLLRRAPAPARP